MERKLVHLQGAFIHGRFDLRAATNVLLVLLVMVFPIPAIADISVELPEGWQLSGSVIYAEGQKVGEIISKRSWPYDSGQEFVESFRQGFEDDPDTTRFISSGVEADIYWVCRKSEYEGANGEYGTWYERRFWVNGPILTMYSYESCTQGFREALEIAKTLSEK